MCNGGFQWLLKGHNSDFLSNAHVIVTEALQWAPGAVCTQVEFPLGLCALTLGCGGHKQAWTPELCCFFFSYCAGDWTWAQVEQRGCVWISSNIFLNIFWIYSKASWMWFWATGSRWPYLSQGAELDGLQRSLLPPVWTTCLKVLKKQQWHCVIFMKTQNLFLYLSR